nr:aldo/keto reductase [Amycolatopsis sp. ATCC 39116]
MALADRILGEAGFRVEAVQNHYSLLYRGSERVGIIGHCREHDVRFFSYMVLEQGALTGRYSPANPLPAGSSRAAVYNGILPQLRALTDRMTAIGADRGASAADIATAWAIAKGTTPIIGVTRAAHLDGLVRAHRIALAGDEIAELEELADAADVDTRGSWEHAMWQRVRPGPGPHPRTQPTRSRSTPLVSRLVATASTVIAMVSTR